MYSSFDDKISEDKDDFNEKLMKSIFKYQRKSDIEELDDLKEALKSEIGDKLDKGNAFVSEENWFKLMQTDTVRKIMEDNLGEKEADNYYKKIKSGEIEMQRTDGKPLQIKFISPKAPIISSRGYVNKKGKEIKSYKRTKPVRFSEPQIRFLKVYKVRLKQKKITSNQIIAKFNSRYKEQQKTSSSLKSKIYRV